MPTVTIAVAAGSSSKREGQSGTTRFTFVVALDEASSSTRSVHWAVSGSGIGSASAADFANGVLPSGLAVLAPGTTSVSVAIDVRGDLLFERDEILTVTLAGPSVGLTLGTSSATAVIENDDVTAQRDVYVVLEGGTLAVPAGSGVLFNDGVEGAAVASPRGLAQHGGVALAADGSFVYVPTAGFTGRDSFSYRASDANGTTGDVEAAIHVVPVVVGAATTLDQLRLTPEEQVAAIYVAYLGRAADLAGFDFWLDLLGQGGASRPVAARLGDLAGSFGSSDEATTLYPFLADPLAANDAAIGGFVAQVYGHLFARPPDEAGLAYWMGQIQARLGHGEPVGPVLVDIIAGAQNTAAGQDITTLMSKVAVTLHYVEEQRSRGSDWTPVDDLADARALLDGVGSDPRDALGGSAWAEVLVHADLQDGGQRPMPVTGTSAGTVIEKGGVLNSVAGDATATGDLDGEGAGVPVAFVPQVDVPVAHGAFSIDADGLWAYVLDDDDAAVQGLNDGDTLVERIGVATADGTRHTVLVAIEGRNDAAVLSAAVATVTTADAEMVAGGTLAISDVDSPATFVAQTATAGLYGTFSVDASGAWHYAVTVPRDALDGGIPHGESFAVTSADGTTTTVTVDILTATGGGGEGDGSFRVDATFLAPFVGFVVRGGAAGGETGWSVSSAGDVNGDGYADLIVGAPGGGAAGEAWVLLGGSAGFGSLIGGRTVVDLANLAPSGGFVIRGDEELDTAGFAVSFAGDVNGDGYADLIVGAPANSNGGTAAGEAYVVLGRASGFGSVVGGRAVLDLSGLAPADGFVVRGDLGFDQAGFSVSSAGDVNGDGYADVIVGAPTAGDVGAAYVVLGRESGFGSVADGRTVIDLTSLAPTDGFIVRGDGAADNAAWSVSSAGDVNGDGYADLIVGAPFDDDGGSNAGAAYVVLGRASGFGSLEGGRSVVDLGSLAPADGFVLRGGAAGDNAGRSVSSAGDVNGDGFDDLIVGAPAGDDGGENAGVAHVVLGRASGFGSPKDGRAVLDLGSLAPSDGFVILGDLQGDAAGWSAAPAGDVNGDGYADLIVGGRLADRGGLDAGEAYVVYGRASGFGSVVDGRRVIDLSSLVASDGFFIQGDAQSDQAGTSVSSAGDVNGDGFDDLIVGAPGSDAGGNGAGAAYVVFGGSFGDPSTPVETTGSAAAEILVGGAGSDRLSGGGGADSIRGGAGNDTISVADLAFRSLAGGSGIDTLVLAGSGLTLDLTDRTLAARISGIERIDLGGPGDGNALILDRRAVLAETAAGQGGLHVLTVTGDVGDAVSLLGAPWHWAGTTVVQAIIHPLLGTILEEEIVLDHYLNGSAEVRVEHGVAVRQIIDPDLLAPRTIDLTSLAPALGFVIRGDAASDGAGTSVSSAGDVDGDGFDDLIVGAPDGDDGGSDAGEAYVVLGRASGIGTLVDGRAVLDLASLAPSDGFVVRGGAADDEAGFSVSSAGDVNGDGFDDLIVGARGAGDGGEAYVVLGRASGFGALVDGRAVIDLPSLAPSEGFVVRGDAAFDEAGFSVSSAGDVNGDGYADLVVGARGGDDGGNTAGEAYVVLGRASGFGSVTGGRSVVDLASLSPSAGFIVQGDAALDQAGFSVSSAGDVNGDGFADLIVGAPGGDDGGSNAGEAYVVLGRASGFGAVVGGRAVVDLTFLAPSDGFVIRGDAASDTAAFSVSSAGDVNGDGYGDLVVGAPTGDDGGGDAGEAYVVLGRASGFGTVADDGRRVIDLTSLGAVDGFVIQGDAAGDNAGYSVSSAGDVNGDGYGDLVIGARSDDDGGSNAGAAYVVLGRRSGFGALVDGRAVLDLGTLSAADGFVVQGDAADDRTGWSVSSAGDVNGDGFADLLVGTPGGDDGGNGAGEAYVLLGGSFGGTKIPVEMTGSASAEILIGRAGDDRLSGGGGADQIRGGAGDDTIVVADLAFRSIDGGGGSDTLALGGSGLILDLTDRAVAARIGGIECIDLGGAGGNTLVLDRPAVLAGGVAAEGARIVTVEGDAGDHVWLSNQPWYLFGTVFEGTIAFDRYVSGNAEARIEQGVTVRQAFDLPSAGSSAGFAVLGVASGDRAGASVSSAGDVNGDGYLDLIVGAPGGGAGRGAAYVVFGRSSVFGTEVDNRSTIDLATLAPADGFVIQGEAAGDNAGFSVSSAGDVNGDGFGDLIVGAPAGGSLEDGLAYVLFGRSSGFGAPVGDRSVIDLARLAPSDGFVLHGARQLDRFGASVSSAGDVNADGFADLIVGAPNGGPSLEPDLYGVSGDAGDAVVVFGGPAFPTSLFEGRAILSLADVVPSEGFFVEGDTADGFAGGSVSSAGDVNGDGFADLIIGQRGGNDGGPAAGEAYVVFGRASGAGTVVEPTTWAEREYWRTGVGGPGFPTGTPRALIELGTLAPTDGFVIQGASAVNQAGFSVSSAGDVNGDGYADLIVGAPYGSDGGGPHAGTAYVLLGRATGFGSMIDGRAVIDLASLAPSAGFVIQGELAGDNAGISVASGGDIDGDGFDDLVVGSGRGVHVVLGREAGFGELAEGRSVIDLARLAPEDGFKAFVPGGPPSVSAADLNGDGFSDLMVGAPHADGTAGAAYVMFGSSELGAPAMPVTRIGTAAADILIGGAGNDKLAGMGGADTIRGGAGNDSISVPDLAFLRIDGGGGTDTLALTGAGQLFDFTALADGRITGIERIVFTHVLESTLRLGLPDVLALSDTVDPRFTAAGTGNALVIEGKLRLELVGHYPDGAGPLGVVPWEIVAWDVGLDGSAGGKYDLYQLTLSGVRVAMVAADLDVLTAPW